MRSGFAKLAVGLISSALMPGILISGVLGALPAKAAEAEACPPLRKFTSLEMQALPDGRMKVPVMLGERSSTLLLDTGSTFRAIRPEVVAAMSLKAIAGGDVVKGIPGQESAQNVVVPSVTLGTLKIPDVGFLVSPPGKLNAAADGLLTLDMLASFDLDLDFAGNQLGLFVQDHCQGKVVYWPADGLAVVPFFFDATNRINFPVRIDGTPMVAVFDTGAAGTSLDLDIARANGMQPATDAMTKTAEVRDGKDVYQRRFKTLSFEDIAVANTMINVLQSGKTAKGAAKTEPGASTPPVVIGMNILRKLHVYVALGERTLYITPGRAAAPASPAAAVSTPAPAPAQ